MDADAYLLLKRYEDDISAPLNAVGVTMREYDAVEWCKNQQEDESARVYQPLHSAGENGSGPASGVAASYTHEQVRELERVLEQACRDLNAAHDKIVELQDEDADPRKHDWPEWSTCANTIRWAEKLLGERLAKTENWTLHPNET